jgi:hypothetical protein
MPTCPRNNKYFVNLKLENCDISFRVVFYLQNKICPFLLQGICIYVGHSFSWNTVGLTLLVLSEELCRVCINAIVLEKRDLVCM